MTQSGLSLQSDSHAHATPRVAARTIRCAVYTRKSSEEGLEQGFNSLDAQREAGADYIKSQRHQGWVQVKADYDDGGFSGGSMQRPGLARLLEDIKLGRVDVVVVYKVDRLSRSLADFARLMQLFDEHGVSFVSVTQQFNTTTSMGRLTLNMLLSFAQFEREVAGERIRDKIAATKRKGVWVTGQPPLGYRVLREGDEDFVPGDRTLRIVDGEAELVRTMFTGYIRHGSLLAVARELNATGHRTRRWTSTRGTFHGGKPLTPHYVHSVLTNPVYIGKITHKRRGISVSRSRARHGPCASSSDAHVYDGLHQPIIDQPTWDAVQQQMSRAKRGVRERCTWSHTHLLKGKVFTGAGSIMSPSSVQRPATSRRNHAASGQKRIVHYYVSQQAIRHGYATCPIKSVNARYLDMFVRDAVCAEIRRRTGIDLLTIEDGARDHAVRDVIARVTIGKEALTIAIGRERMHALRTQAIGALPSKATVADDAQSATYSAASGAHDITPTIEEDDAAITLTFAIAIKRFDGRRLVLNQAGTRAMSCFMPEARGRPAQHIRLAIGLAFAWRDALLRRNITIAHLAREHGLAESRVHRLLTLTQLEPALLHALLVGGNELGLSLGDVIRAAGSLQWGTQANHCDWRCRSSHKPRGEREQQQHLSDHNQGD